METRIEDTFEASGALFAEVILPLAAAGTFTYRIPLDLAELVTSGKRVSVQFGKNKVYAALVYSLSDKPPASYEAKNILDVLDDEPIVSITAIEFWTWLSAYYFCSLGEVMKAALPPGLRLEGETELALTLAGLSDQTDAGLSLTEQHAVTYLANRKRSTVSALAAQLEIKSALSVVRRLFGKGIIDITEGLPERPTLSEAVVTTDYNLEQASLQSLFNELKGAPRQLNLLRVFQNLVGKGAENAVSVPKRMLLKDGGSASALASLVKKGIFKVSYPTPLPNSITTPVFSVVLSAAQEEARKQIEQDLLKKSVCLLHGVTSSGKTEVYLSLIFPRLLAGKQVLYLLPEIALTSQIVHRLKEQFGSKVGLYHSRMTERERTDVWQKTLSGEIGVVLGARSALFVPFVRLDLVIVDEEHEQSFKQQDPAPRYHARDAAIYLASLWSAKTLLGSATPSVETYHHTQNGKYALVNLTERFGGVQPPDIQLIDLRMSSKEKTLTGHFSRELADQMKQVLEKAEQGIIFQNRRGYAPLLLCSRCGYIPRCVNCDVSLTYHKETNNLRCHYCGFKSDLTRTCAVCSGLSVIDKGLGTEKIEEEIASLFPYARISRMDLDTTRSKHAYTRMLEQMAEKEVDFLVGTQMISRGLDFASVSLTAILAADSMLNFPDFRAFERGFQLLLQVSGRAGRRATRGKVIIQTYFPEHPVLTRVKNGDYEGLYFSELKERKIFNYPPFCRLIRVIMKHRDGGKLSKISALFGTRMKNVFSDMVVGPEDALVPRVRNWYIKEMMIKINLDRHSPQAVKETLRKLIETTSKNRETSGLLIQVDVDPY